MEALGSLTDHADAVAKLGPLVSAYRDWIAAQEASLDGLHLPAPQRMTAEDLIRGAKVAADRIADGLARLDGPEALDAFKIANRAMARAARRRRPDDAPQWRAFQLAFVLMNLTGLADPAHPEREIVDLLFFPTGGGKTEAYLGLAAFTLVLRRLRNQGAASAGVSILMRYTLRLLTLDTKHQLLSATMLYRGSVSSAPAWIAEVFREAVRRNASAIAVAHNHPSGDPSPSADDIAFTQAVVEAGALLEIRVLDYLVFGHGRYVSMRERRLGFA